LCVESAIFLFWHFRVNDTPAGGHPLNATGFDNAFISGVILVAHAAIQQVGDRFKSAVWMRWETGDVVIGVIRTKGIQ
jgi:hypothetical protein